MMNQFSLVPAEQLSTSDSTTPYSLRQLLLYFLYLGTFGFGGPIALIGYMHRDLVEKRKWISEDEYREGLALAQLAPGPLAAQLAIYLGYVHHKIIGATLTGVLFVLPSFLMVLALGIAYKAYEGLSWVQLVFYGISAAVIGIIAVSAYKLVKKTVKKDLTLVLIFIVLVAVTVRIESESVLLFLLAGIINWLVKAPPKFLKRDYVKNLVPVLLWFQHSNAELNEKLWKIFWFFGKAGALVFGSGLAIIPFLYGGLVKEYGWLNNQEFTDSVAVAMITPGPVVITVGFIGYLVAGYKGACVAALATFLPCYFFTVLPAPYFKKYGKKPGLNAFVTGVTAAATGAITGAVIILGKRTIVDIPTILIGIVTVIILVSFKKIPEPLIILAAGVTGILIKGGVFV